jgi:hypothetical protein
MRTLLLLALASCTAVETRVPSPPSGVLPARLPERLEACGLVTPGELRADLFYAPTTCYDVCLGTAGCDELEAALCQTSIDLLRRCDEACAFRCPDGSLIAVEQRCDGQPACAGGADERDCGTCVEEHPDWWCNGVGECADGSDERDCGECPWFHPRCDGSRDCAGGSDERDCFACESGESVLGSARCDGWPACIDGSDERGCAEVVAACGT